MDQRKASCVPTVMNQGEGVVGLLGALTRLVSTEGQADLGEWAEPHQLFWWRHSGVLVKAFGGSGEGSQGFWWRHSGILVKAFGVQQWSHLWCLSLLCFEGEMSPTGWVFEQFIPSWWCYLGRYGRLRWGSLGISAWGWGSEVLYPSPLSICPLLPDYRHNVTRTSLSCCMQCLQCLCRPDCTLGLWAKITLLSLSCFCRVISYSNKKTNKNILKNTEIGTQGVSSHLKERIKFMTTDPSFLWLMALDLGHSPKGKGIHDGCGNHGAHHCCYWYKQCILSIRQVRPLL